MFEKWGRGSYPYVRGKLPELHKPVEISDLRILTVPR